VVVVSVIIGQIKQNSDRVIKETIDEGLTMNSTTPLSELLPDIQFFLSRPSYPLGGTVVGTVVIRRSRSNQRNKLEKMEGSIAEDGKYDDRNHRRSTNNSLPEEEIDDDGPSLREILQSVTVYVAGFCKIDSRWHIVSDYTKIYGKVHPYLMSLQDSFDADLFLQSEDTVCFWATNGLEVLQLPERREGRWDNEEMKRGNAVLAFTFRVDLPNDLPHSVNATTCRYFYSANVLVKMQTQQQVLKRNFLVTTDPDQAALPSSMTAASKQHHSSNTANMIITGRVKFGSCVGMAHSNGLPCHLSASEIQRPTGQMTVVQRDRNSSVQEDVQTMRVSNASGQPVCLMTLIGSQTMTPGSHVQIIWDFPKTFEKWIPCYQVSACIQGEEHAVFEDGSTKRSRTFLVDTCHEWVEPGITDSISKTMLFSSNDMTLEGTPCNLSTDIVKVSMCIRVDITVDGEPNANGIIEDYHTLPLHIPCRIRHFLENEDELMEMEETRVVPLRELLGETEDDVAFPTKDILPDLKILATHMERHLRTR
jgi:hypothetical protein